MESPESSAAGADEMSIGGEGRHLLWRRSGRAVRYGDGLPPDQPVSEFEVAEQELAGRKAVLLHALRAAQDGHLLRRLSGRAAAQAERLDARHEAGQRVESVR